MGGRTDAVRYILSFINALFLLAGLATVAVGLWLFFTMHDIWMFGDVAEYSESQSLRNFWIADVIFFSAGVAVVVFGFTGICGVCVRNSCMWAFQAVCFLLVIGVHIAALIFAVDSFAQHEKSSSAMRNELRQRYDGVGVNVYSQRFGQLQESYECCGVNGVTDYTAELEAFERYNANLGTLRSFPPRSCLGADDEVSSQGCHESVKNALYNLYVSILVLSSVSIFCALLLFVLAICLCVRYKEDAIITHL